MGVLLLCGLPLSAQDNQSPKPTLNHAQYFGVSARLDELAKLPQPPQYGFHEAPPLRLIHKANFGSSVDPAQRSADYPAEFAVNVNILGVGNGFPGYTVPDAPPDTNMAVGDTQILQWVNVSYTICSKTGSCGSAILGNTLWAAGIPGTLCANNNDGDILAQFDRKAHRWVLMQNVFVSPYAVCIAVSTTASATGTYYVYQFSVPGNGFPDYPKLGIWSSGGASDGYFTSMNNFGPGGSGFRGPQPCGYDRTKLLAGDPTAEQICFQLTAGEDSLLPGDVDSPTSPPSAQTEFYIGSVGDVDNSHLSLYSMQINNWATGSAVMTGSPNTQLLTVATYSGSCSGSFGGACVPQLGTTSRLDSLGDRLMYRFAYWRDPVGPSNPPPPHPIAQYWFVNGDVESNGVGGQIGVRWYELRGAWHVITAATLAGSPPFQQQTYAGSPGDSNYRWMGSLTRDNVGDILLGYSLSSTILHPAIGLAGREPSDAPSTLSTEALLCNLGPSICAYVIPNNGSQPDTSNRWGDYSAMRIDPVDNCTFWYTTEYYMVTLRFDWSTQIVSAKFPLCQ
jgi:hypothetical protein